MGLGERVGAAHGMILRTRGSSLVRAGSLAQLAEQGTFNPKVVGSRPTRPTRKHKLPPEKTRAGAFLLVSGAPRHRRRPPASKADNLGPGRCQRNMARYISGVEDAIIRPRRRICVKNFGRWSHAGLSSRTRQLTHRKDEALGIGVIYGC